MNLLDRIFKRQPREAQAHNAQIVTGSGFTFTAWNGDAYANDVYRGAVDAIARNAGKLKASHVVQYGGKARAEPDGRLRAADPAGKDSLIITGMPIVYNQPTTVHDPAGAYTEIIRGGALDGADLSDARLLYNHDQSRVPLARTPRTMQLLHDPAGLRMAASLPDTGEARAVHTAVERGDLSGMSFAFKVPTGGDRYDPATRTREIFKIEKVYEVSIVPFPAYPQTSVEARAAMQTFSSPERLQAVIAVNQLLIKEIVP